MHKGDIRKQRLHCQSLPLCKRAFTPLKGGGHLCKTPTPEKRDLALEIRQNYFIFYLAASVLFTPQVHCTFHFSNTTLTASHATNYHHETSIIFIILQMVKMRDSLASGHNESVVEAGSHLSFLSSFLQTAKLYYSHCLKNWYLDLLKCI